MSTDDDYASFLDKANQDTGSSKPSQKDTKFAATKAVDTDVPAPLQKLGDAFYTSDTDEPFEAVALGHSGKEIDKREYFIDHVLFQKAQRNHLSRIRVDKFRVFLQVD